VCEQPGAAGHASAVLRDRDLAVDHDQIAPLVDLVLGHLLAGRKMDGDCASLGVGAQHLWMVGLDV
jgi:hypothetical protein